MLFSILLEVPARSTGQYKGIKNIQIRKKEGKLSLFADKIISYIRNPKDSTKSTVGNKTFSKVSGYKINIKKSVVFIHTHTEICGKEMRKPFPFKIE